MNREKLENIMKIELNSEWKLDLHTDWKGNGWEGEALSQSKTIVLFAKKETDCFHGFLHELAHAIEIEKGHTKKCGESHDVFYADTLTKLIGKYCLSKSKHKEIMDQREHTHQINLECAREGAKENILQKAKEVIDKILSCSLTDLPKGQQCNDTDCLNCCKNKELKKGLGIKNG